MFDSEKRILGEVKMKKEKKQIEILIKKKENELKKKENELKRSMNGFR